MIVIAGLDLDQQAVHAGGDDRQPPCGAFLFVFLCCSRLHLIDGECVLLLC